MRARRGEVSSGGSYGMPRGGGGGGDSYTTSYRERPSGSYTNSYRERPPGVGTKVGNSCVSMLLGLIFIFLGCLLLWNNEGWAIRTHRSLNEALDAHNRIPDAKALPTGEFEDKLVHMSHTTAVDSPTVDEEFGLAREAVSLSRNVEIFQWVEVHKKERRKLANGETEVTDRYSYNKKWVGSPVSSDRFQHPGGHENYGDLPFRAATFNANSVNMGAYQLSKAFTAQLKSSSAVPVGEVKRIPNGGKIQAGKIYFSQGDGNGNGMPGLPSTGGDKDLGHAVDKKIVSIDGKDKIMYSVKATGEMFSTQDQAMAAAGRAPAVPAERRAASVGGPLIGDARVGFTEVRCGVVSVLGRLAGDTLTSWPSKQGPGYDIAILIPGQRSAEDMVSGAQASNNIFMWVKRTGGWLLNWIGFSMVTQIISTAADISLNWIPLLGPMTTSIINLGLSIANFVLASTTSLLIASVAWVRYRPVLGITLLVGSLGLFFLASQAGGKAKGRKVGYA